MQYINLEISAYLVAYLKKKYPQVNGAVVLPEGSLSWWAIVNGCQLRMPHQLPVEGNVIVAISDIKLCKDLSRNNHLSAERMKLIDDLFRLEFDMELIEKMERAFYREGIDYQDSAISFHEYYGLEGLLTEEALLQKHVRWKRQRRRREGAAVQGELELR